MCTDPQTSPEGHIYACRRCDACISTRRFQWEALAMAEKACHAHTVMVTLTYDETSQHNRDSARIFNYGDVSAFLKRLRRAAQYKTPGAYVRFIVAGEQGSRNGRCHWHVILYSNVELWRVGVLTNARGLEIKRPEDLFTYGKHVKRLGWTTWGHGLVTFQKADYAEVSYAISYCLKDQFTVEASHSMARARKAERFATGLFRVSKKPPIGETWISNKLDRLDRVNAVLPSLEITIPGLRGWWVPSGKARKRILGALRAINRRVRWHTGKDCQQWASLLAASKDIETDLKVLHGQIEEIDDYDNPKSEDFRSIRNEGPFAASVKAHGRAVNDIRRRCGNTLPCFDCLGHLSTDTLNSLGLVGFYEGAEWRVETPEGWGPQWDEVKPLACNRYCERRDSAETRAAFAIPPTRRS